ncbi:hypothetical protein [Pseudarthrobacter phenanthrenivorans]|uniref:hypothetical protein n=1 Tax=Pseudarthrobacter phenanthrenivorans TaxID=361575 RepID=UPI0020B846C3|nr:hypothetical protein [Pseudarthrobacter phenanthrenivorans]
MTGGRAAAATVPDGGPSEGARLCRPAPAAADTAAALPGVAAGTAGARGPSAPPERLRAHRETAKAPVAATARPAEARLTPLPLSLPDPP